MEWKNDQIHNGMVRVLADDHAGMNSPFLAQHGVSFFISWEHECKQRHILFDTGTYAEPILNNMKRLGIDPADIEMIILSHCHYDHTGGLIQLLETSGRRGIPIIAHPDIFRVSFVTDPVWTHVGFPEPDAEEMIRKAGGMLVLVREPVLLAPGMMLSGEVPRITEFESTGSLRLFSVHQDRIIPDSLADDLSLYINTDYGLVVITGCAHAGIINIIRQGQILTGISTVNAVIGGFHLNGAADEKIENTIAALRSTDVRKIYSGHCTGLKAESMLMNAFGNRYEQFYCGKTICFDS